MLHLCSGDTSADSNDIHLFCRSTTPQKEFHLHHQRGYFHLTRWQTGSSSSKRQFHRHHHYIQVIILNLNGINRTHPAPERATMGQTTTRAEAGLEVGAEEVLHIDDSFYNSFNVYTSICKNK